MSDVKSESIQYKDPISLDIDDKILLKNIKNRIALSKADYDEKKLGDRQSKNRKYYLGQQLEEGKFKDHNSRYQDNAIYESEQTIIPIALSRTPDLLVKQGMDTPDSAKKAEILSKVLSDDIKKRELKQVVEIALKHVPIYFIGIIKYRWNPEKGKNGDYEFEVIHPSRVVIDSNAKGQDENKIDFIDEKFDIAIKELCMRFPDKEEDILRVSGIEPEEKNKNEEKMASNVEAHECWFTWYEDEGKGEYSRMEGVVWYYKSVLLKKMKNPNWDWEGEKRTFVYDTAKKETRKPTLEEYQRNLNGQQVSGFGQETIFHNFFENPEKPYILLGYDQLGESVYDATSRIEQVLYLQDNLDKRGRQITEMADRVRGMYVFSSDGGLKKGDIQRYDTANPNLKLWVKGDPSKVVHQFPGEQPSPALFQDRSILKDSIFSKLGTHSTTQGKKETNVATTSQILREADYGRIDHFTEVTVNYAYEKIARASMQMIKLRYTEDHLRRIVGNDGKIAFETVNRDLIEEGQEVIVYASSVDKTMRKREAYERAKMKMTDPLTFFEDTDVPNPKERTIKLMTFMSDPQTYVSKYLMGLETPEQQSNSLNNINPQQNQSQEQQTKQQGGGQQALLDIQLLMSGQQVTPPSVLDQQYLQTFDNFIKSSDFKNMTPEQQGLIIQYSQQLSQSAQAGIIS